VIAMFKLKEILRREACFWLDLTAHMYLDMSLLEAGEPVELLRALNSKKLIAWGAILSIVAGVMVI
jgi:hypothetical protein